MRQGLTSQKLYQEVRDTLKKTEDSLLKLEKISFSMSPIFEEVEGSLDALIKILKSEKVHGLCRQIRSLKTRLNTLENKKGYDSDTFQNIFALLKKIRKENHTEILSIARLRDILGRNALGKFKEFNKQFFKAPANSLNASPPKKFLMLKDSSTSFLVPIKKKIWQKKIINKAYKDEIKIQLKSDKIHGAFVFKSILQGEREKRSSQRVALLVRNENDDLKGILSDETEGIIYLSPSVFLNKLKYLKVNHSTSKSFIWLKGRRFFIRSLA